MMRDAESHQLPKLFRVIEFAKVTKLVHDHIIHQVWGKENKPEVEIQIPLFRAAPPS